jgi:23S rRNA pseudouridine2605 synthase
MNFLEVLWKVRRDMVVDNLERLQKYLARSGVTSRRRAEEMIKQGLVKVNGQVIREMGVRIEPEKDVIEVRGKLVEHEKRKIYILMYKPAQVVTTLADPQGRKKVSDLLREVEERIYPVGRLDYNTEGLLLLTNDGELTYRLTHPKFKIKKTYLTRVQGSVTDKAIKELHKGVLLADGLTQPAHVKLLQKTPAETWLELTISEGRNRQVRRMCEQVGHPVIYLKRIRLGTLALGNLQRGQYRYLNETEIAELKKLCHLS